MMVGASAFFAAAFFAASSSSNSSTATGRLATKLDAAVSFNLLPGPSNAQMQHDEQQTQRSSKQTQQ